MGRFIDLTGHKFGRLTVLERSYKKGDKIHWRCSCECGNETHVRGNTLKCGSTRSCGCLYDEPSPQKTHGLSKSSVYNTWKSMRRRCSKPNYSAYENYGGRGIQVCDRWQNSFENFYEDMGDKPTPEHSIDRIDNDGHYEPGNCRWADKRTQSRNQRVRKETSSKYRGVSWCKSRKKWVVGILVGKTNQYLGGFSSEILAAQIYDKKAREIGYHEDWLNFPYHGFDPKTFIEEDEL